MDEWEKKEERRKKERKYHNQNAKWEVFKTGM